MSNVIISNRVKDLAVQLKATTKALEEAKSQAASTKKSI
jgi:hypothetical protein